MSKFLSIFLLGLLIYNMVGYSIVYLTEEKYSISKTDNQLVERNSASDDILIKVPVAIPYQTDWDAPEPAEGQIEHNGEFYQMVSRQLLNDTLVVHCVLDENARDQFMSLVTKMNDQVTGNTSQSEKQAPSKVLKSFLKEYMSVGKKHVFYLLEWVAPVPQSQFFCEALPESFTSIPSPPPNQG